MTMQILRTAAANSQYQLQKDDITSLLIERHMGRMRPAEKQAWIEALRSEAFKGRQGRRYLQTPGGNFCCLGVKCEIDNVPSEVRLAIVDSFSQNKVPVVHYGNPAVHDSYSFIPHQWEIKLYAEGQQDNPDAEPIFYYNGGTSLFRGWVPAHLADDGSSEPERIDDINLPTLNDDGLTFDQIADVINYFL